MARVLQEELITADMAGASKSSTWLSCADAAEIFVTTSPGHVNTTGWTLTIWGRASETSRAMPDSPDVVSYTVEGAGLPARILAATKPEIFDNPGWLECYVQVSAITGDDKAVFLTVVVG